MTDLGIVATDFGIVTIDFPFIAFVGASIFVNTPRHRGLLRSKAKMGGIL